MGANNASISGGGATYQVARITNPNGAQASVMWQNNTLGYFTMYPTISDGRDGTSDPNQIIKAGEGTVVFAAANTYSGQTYVNGGNLVITADAGLGAPANATVANLNGGTIVANATFTLDNNGTNMRPITLLGNGGGLAADGGQYADGGRPSG
jgi:autotransporter-associated beta strand protein